MNFIGLATTGNSWVAGLGDPTPMGWFTVFAYFAASILCLCAAAKPLYSSKPKDQRIDLRFWLILAGLMFVFGINKQLDFQTLITVSLKNLAEATGLYNVRRLLQVLFIVAVVAVGIWLTRKFYSHYRRSAQRNRLAVLGMALLIVFIATRATSFHYIDSLISASIAGIKVNWILELGSISLIAIAATMHLRRHSRQSKWQSQLRHTEQSTNNDSSARTPARSSARESQQKSKLRLNKTQRR